MTRPELKWWDALLALGGSLVIVGATFVGMAMNVLIALLMLYAPIAIGTRIWGAVKRTLELGFFRNPFAPERRWFLFQAIVRAAFVLVSLVVVRVSIVPTQLGDELGVAWLQIGGVLAVALIASFFPRRRVFTMRLLFVLTTTFFFSAQLVMLILPASSAEMVRMPVPLQGDVVVLQGGASPLVNHHWVLRSQRSALDLVMLRNGKMIDGDPKALGSYGCFDAPIHAPLAGTVMLVVSDRPDMEIGKTDIKQIVGNSVVIQVEPERFVMFAHMKRESATVRVGDAVETGQVIGRCGNSGNTSFPHLHLQVQSRAGFTASDLRTFPIVFPGDARPPRRNDRYFSKQ